MLTGEWGKNTNWHESQNQGSCPSLLYIHLPPPPTLKNSDQVLMCMHICDPLLLFVHVNLLN